MITFYRQALALTVFLLTIVHPVLSHPIRESGQVIQRNLDIDDGTSQDSDTGRWSLNDKGRTLSSLESAQAEFKLSKSVNSDPAIEGESLDNSYTPGEDIPPRPVVSVLVPVSAVSVIPHDYYGEGVDALENDPIEVPGLMDKHYGQMLGHSETGYDAGSDSIHDYYDSEYYTTSMRFSSGHYISFLSYRVSLPFLKFAPMSFASFPLPGIFTTVIVLLALVWIAILTIGLVEFGNYLWNGTEPGNESGQYGVRDGYETGNEDYELAEEGQMSKPHMIAIGIPFSTTEGLDEEVSGSLISSESDSESEIGDYRVV